ncbi:hypothetical protein DENIS_4082 [Desulfonema ishimotonii]|uniref:Zinc-finger domain-containing protein n=1 Tax=Desulfonema ishimotonii TaxID=45657 RepID=A0A401G1M8_9BACT|nr:hypothetical protein [Desulfonema ishimotonii]GBC63093.1 hypothetical protein DENIS_4082 [Desulfonema ishimotonii]
MRSRHHALIQARIFRTCPPADILNDPAHAAEVRRHLEQCAHCSRRLREETAWCRWAERLREKLNPGRHESHEIVPGRLCLISPDAGQWHGDYFYTPPLVLVAEMPRTRFSTVKVFQTWHDICLAAPGDLILSEAETGGDALFAEGWNAFTIDAGLLEPTSGRVSPRIIDTLNGLAENPAAYPDWALIPRPLTANDPRTDFRRIEAGVSKVFSGGKLTVPNTVPPPLYPAEDARFLLRESAPGYHAAPLSEALKQISEVTGSPLEKSEAGIMAIKDGRMKRLRALSLGHKRFRLSEKTLTVQGAVANLAEIPADSDVSDIALVSGTELRTAVTFSWNRHTGRFSAVFEIPTDTVVKDQWKILLILAGAGRSE